MQKRVNVLQFICVPCTITNIQIRLLHLKWLDVETIDNNWVDALKHTCWTSRHEASRKTLPLWLNKWRAKDGAGRDKAKNFSSDYIPWSLQTGPLFEQTAKWSLQAERKLDNRGQSLSILSKHWGGVKAGRHEFLELIFIFWCLLKFWSWLKNRALARYIPELLLVEVIAYSNTSECIPKYVAKKV